MTTRKRQPTLESPRTSESRRSERRRLYRRPELEEYGSLRELTRTLDFLSPGDILATSFGG